MSTPQSLIELEDLAQNIANDVSKYVAALREHGCSLPTHDASVPRNETLPTSATRLQLGLIESITELQALVQGPVLHLHNQVLIHTNLVNLHALYKFDLPKRVPIDGNISYSDLAKATEVDESVLRRIVRYAITKYIFREVDSDHVGHTATSKMLTEMPMMLEFIGMVCEEMWPAATKAISAITKWPGSQEPQHSGYAIAHNIQTNLFEMLGNEPERAGRFANAMVYFNASESLSPAHLCDAFDWSKIQHFVDIGGSSGSTAVAMARRFPNLTCTVQDIAALEEKALSSIPADVSNRVSFLAHDFFQEQPVKDADVYHFRWVFHDWPDKYCINILRALVPALKRGARFIVSDLVVPVSGSTSKYREGFVRGFDLAMMELFNAKEREESEWEKMFSEADSRFKFDGVRVVELSDLAYISAVWEGDS